MTSSEGPLYLNETTVRSILTWPMAYEALEEAFKAVSSKPHEETDINAYQPLRSLTIAGNNGILLTMPGFVSNYKLTIPTGTTKTYHTLACKLITAFQANETHQPPLPQYFAIIFLFSSLTGKLKCFMDGNQITAWRTASASIVATKYLYFDRLSYVPETHDIKLAIIGCGVQGRFHALGMCARYRVTQVKLWNRTISKAKLLAEDLRSQYAHIKVIEVAGSSAEAVADADVICVGTASTQSLVDHSMLTQQNVHINTVGAGKVHFGEIAQDIYDKATVYVDSWSAAKAELTELKSNLVAEVGEIINGSVSKPTATGITIFQSMGMAAEDATVAQAVFEAYNHNNIKPN